MRIDDRIIDPILSKVKKVNGKSYKTDKGKSLYFSSLNQLQVIYIALKEFAPQLKNCDANRDRNHNKRTDKELDRLKYDIEFYSIDCKDKESITISMLMTRNEILDKQIEEIKKICNYFNFSKKQIRNIMPFLRDTMILIAENRIEVEQELYELNMIIERNTVDGFNIPISKNNKWI